MVGVTNRESCCSNCCTISDRPANWGPDTNNTGSKDAVLAAAAVAVAGGGGGDAGGAEEQSDFTVELADAGGQKIAVIKAVKEILGLGLKEAKDMVDGAPAEVKAGVPKEEAEEMKAKLEEAGATVNLK